MSKNSSDISSEIAFNVYFKPIMHLLVAMSAALLPMPSPATALPLKFARSPECMGTNDLSFE
jgi:hypothetical protein